MRSKVVKRVSTYLVCLTLAFAMMSSSFVVFADGDTNEESPSEEPAVVNTTWQSDFEYTISDGNIVLSKYEGSDENLVIPSSAVIDGVTYNTKLANNCNYFFKDNKTIKTVDFGDINTSNVTSMNQMFSGCSSLQSLDLSKWNTSNVTTMWYMFYGCTSLKSINFGSIDTGNVTNMSRMFHGCSALTNLDLSKFNTSKVTNMSYMFMDCSKLQTLDISGFDASKVKDTSAVSNEYMLGGCSSLVQVKTPINLAVAVDLPYTFYNKERVQEEFTTLPQGTTESITIIKKGGVAPVDPTPVDPTPVDPTPVDPTPVTPSANVVEVDTAKGTATVKDDVIGGNTKVSVECIKEGKVYRMYDPNRGEHFYTKNTSEMQQLINLGWRHEANADFTVVDATDEDAKAVYRVYNNNNGGIHFYTDDASEVRVLINAGWSYEGISHYVYKNKRNSTKGVEQYRFYNPNSKNGEHNWTADTTECNMLRKAGWIDEGVRWRIV